MNDKEAQIAGLKKLLEPFPEDQVNKLPKGTKAQNACPPEQKKNCKICGGWHHPKVIHLDYVGHAALTKRLLEVDPFWNWEPIAVDEKGAPVLDSDGGMWINLTICGVTRRGYGDSGGKRGPDANKERIGDAIRNGAMRFGCAVDMWIKTNLATVPEEKEEETTTSGFWTDKLDKEIELNKDKEHDTVEMFLKRNKGKIYAMTDDNEKRKVLSYITEMQKEYPHPVLVSIREGCRAFTNLDVFTDAWETKCKPLLSKLNKEELEEANKLRLATIKRLQGE